MNHFLKNRLLDVCSAFLIGLGIFSLISLFSYSPNDPSLNHISDAEIMNWGGKLGANLSTLYLGFIGATAFFVSVIFLVWGAKIIKMLYRDDEISRAWYKHPLMRFSFLLFFIMFTAAAFGALDNAKINPDSWPSTSYGGYIGYMLNKLLSGVLTPIGYAALFTILALPLFIITLGISRLSWERIWYITSLVVTAIALNIGRAISAAARFILVKIGRVRADELVHEDEAPVKKPRKLIRRVVDDEQDDEEEEDRPKRRKAKPRQESLDVDMSEDFQLPPLSLLSLPDDIKRNKPNDAGLSANAEMLERVLDEFGVKGKIFEIQVGPVVTLYSFEPAAGIKSSRVIGLADDIARSMSATSARIAVIPGQNAIGIELPNSYRETVYFKELLTTDDFKKTKHALPLAIGKDISGAPVIIDLVKTPHLLVAGTTGSGKSVGINGFILSLLYKFSPEECKFIMIDPKMLELSVYQDIPHLLAPVVTEPGKAVVALKWVVREMENRYRMMSNLNVRNLDGFNKKIEEALERGETLKRHVQTGYDPETGQPIIEDLPIEMKKLPFIVVIVDEMADLMLVAGKDIEGSVQRLAQMARAAGIHLILATQRPSVDVITGVIKANFPSRISFQVTSKIDSRTILGEQGAEQLLGQGDQLYMAGGSRITRVHGAFISDKEVENITKYLRSQGKPNYIEDVTTSEEDLIAEAIGGSPSDSLYDQAVAIVIRDGKASTSYIQRCLKIGYNKAANLIEEMERNGVVSQPDHVGRREILIK
jgi:S-DNA-T family DNA segregation ATPase FtsK/SpoIIIE